jgi:chromo domain-containing protein 1
MVEEDGIGNISDTTLEEDPEPDQDWNVEGILAEAGIGDENHYLVDWTGYTLADASWEPGSNLLGSTLEEWTRENLSKEAQEANIDSWYKARLKLQHGKVNKARSRDERRRARGLGTTTSLAEAEAEFKKTYDNAREFDVQFSDMDTSDDDADTSYILPPPKNIPAKDRSSSSWPGKLSVARPRQPSDDKSIQATKDTDKATPLPQQTEARAKTDNTPPCATGTGYRGTARSSKPPASSTSSTAARAATVLARSTSTSLPTPTSRSPPVPSGPTQNTRTARRSNAVTASKAANALSSTNIFIGGTKRKQRKSFHEMVSDPSKGGKAFSTARFRNMVFKRSRESADRAPKTLPKLFRISDGPKSAEQKASTKQESPQSTDQAQEDVAMVEPPTKKKRKSVRFEDDAIAPATAPSLVVFAGELVDEPMTADTGHDGLFVPLGSVAASPVPELIKAQATSDETPSNSAPDSAQTTPGRKVTLQDYHQRQHSLLSIKKSAVFGHPRNRNIGVIVDGVRRLPDSDVPYSTFLDAKVVTFTHHCAAKDFWFQIENIVGNILGSGYITSISSAHLMERAAERLRLGSFGAICFGDTWAMVVFPADTEAWLQVDEKLKSHPKPAPSSIGILRYIAFAKATDARPASHSDWVLPANHSRQPRTAAFEKLLGLEYLPLLPGKAVSSSTSIRHGFYLAFPGEREDMLKAICLWLMECNPDSLVATSLDGGSWRWFLDRNVTTSATIIIHELALPTIRRFPNFFQTTSCSDSRVNFWCLSESLRRYPLVPSSTVSDGLVLPPATIKMHRLLPTGFIVLLTPSFLLTQPGHALAFMRWFRSTVKPQQFLFKKVAVFHDVVEWLSDVHHQRTQAYERNAHSRGELERWGMKEEDFNARRWLLEALHELVDMSSGDSSTAFDEEAVPLVFCPEDIDANDEQSQVNWFIHFSLSNLDRFRRFIVLGTDEEDTESERRCTINIKMPKYVAGTANCPDYQARRVDRQMQEDRGQNQQMMPAAELATAQHEAPIPARCTMMANENATEFVKILQPITKMSPLAILYERPVGYHKLEMADHYGNHTAQYETYKEWFSFLFPFQPRNPKCTYIGLFYTVVDDWDPTRPRPAPYDTCRHPWVAFYRPVDPHKYIKTCKRDLPQREYQVVIWDCHAAQQLPAGDTNPTENCLLPAQKALVDFVRGQTGEKNPGTQIAQVWLGGGDRVPNSPTSHPLDTTLTFIQNVMHDLKSNVPATAYHLRERGYRQVDPVQKAKEPSIKAADVAFAGNRDNDIKKMIFHPPRGNPVVRASKCENHLFKRCSLARAAKIGLTFPFGFQSTQRWYKDQHSEGRGAEHILIASWGRVFEELRIREQHQPPSQTRTDEQHGPPSRGHAHSPP